ncbi:MAG: hypothetical protein FK734_20130 [Asgard group archaeon]|nr:hypothetical protein [Asgard group archaeon]
MKNKIPIIASILVINIILLSFSNVAGSVVWFYSDDVDDVEFYVNSIPQYEGDYHDEIDMIQIDLNNSNIIFKMQAVPIDDANHIHYLTIYWTQTAGFNSTTGIFGMGNNIMATFLHNSTGQEVASSEVQSSIIISGEQIIMPIPIFAQIPGTDDPYYIQVQTIVTTGANEYYQDYSNGTIFSTPTDNPTPTLPISLVCSIGIVVSVFVVIRKKRQ